MLCVPKDAGRLYSKRLEKDIFLLYLVSLSTDISLLFHKLSHSFHTHNLPHKFQNQIENKKEVIICLRRVYPYVYKTLLIIQCIFEHLTCIRVHKTAYNKYFFHVLPNL